MRTSKSSIILSLFCTVLISNCAQNSSTTSNLAFQKKQLLSEIQIQFQFPQPLQQIGWDEIKHDEFEKKQIVEYVIKGTTSATTLARVLHQKTNLTTDLKQIKATILDPLDNCSDSEVQELPIHNEYTHKESFVAFCSHFKNEPYGLIDYGAIFIDQLNAHVILAEVRIPPAKTLEELNIATAETSDWHEASIILSNLFEEMMTNIQVCDLSNKICI